MYQIGNLRKLWRKCCKFYLFESRNDGQHCLSSSALASWNPDVANLCSDVGVALDLFTIFDSCTISDELQNSDGKLNVLTFIRLSYSHGDEQWISHLFLPFCIIYLCMMALRASVLQDALVTLPVCWNPTTFGRNQLDREPYIWCVLAKLN